MLWEVFALLTRQALRLKFAVTAPAFLPGNAV
jgi:hypothetical protein